jgi:hypothetical protein
LTILRRPRLRFLTHVGIVLSLLAITLIISIVIVIVLAATAL